MVKSTTGTAPPTKPPGSGPGGVVAPPRAPRRSGRRPPLGRGVARASDAESDVGWAWAWNCWARERSEDNLWKEPKAEKKEHVEPAWGENLGKMYENVKCSLCWVGEVLCMMIIMIATLLFHVFSCVGHFVSCNEVNLWVDTQTSQVSRKSGPLMASY